LFDDGVRIGVLVWGWGCAGIACVGGKIQQLRNDGAANVQAYGGGVRPQRVWPIDRHLRLGLRMAFLAVQCGAQTHGRSHAGEFSSRQPGSHNGFTLVSLAMESQLCLALHVSLQPSGPGQEIEQLPTRFPSEG